MKEKIHPTYYPNAQVRCACGNTFTVGSTKQALKVEICSACHPFFTGQQRIVDTAGRVERFRRKYGKFGAVPSKPAPASETPTQAPA